jgi:hypothetical protein
VSAGFCTYTVDAHRDDGRKVDVPCALARIGWVEGPGFTVALCRRHFEVVSRQMSKSPAAGVTLTLDAQDDLPLEGPVGLATAAVEDVVRPG